jgi:hypothetical protein
MQRLSLHPGAQPWGGPLALAIALVVLLAAGLLAADRPAFAAPAAQAGSVSLGPSRVATAGKSRCGPAGLSTLGTNCLGFDGRDVRSLSDLWVVGYENNKDLGEKHVLQTLYAFDLAPLRNRPPNTTVGKASLSYLEASTVRRSAGGESEYGILPTCNTGLGVPVDGWDGNLDGVIPTQPAAVAGVQGATTGSGGAWDVTPQLQQWLNAPNDQRAFVLRGDDESLDVKDLAMCLSYVFDLGLSVEYAPQP